MKYDIYKANVKKAGPRGIPEQDFEYMGRISVDVPIRVGEMIYNCRVIRINYCDNNLAEVQIEGSTFR